MAKITIFVYIIKSLTVEIYVFEGLFTVEVLCKAKNTRQFIKIRSVVTRRVFQITNNVYARTDPQYRIIGSRHEVLAVKNATELSIRESRTYCINTINTNRPFLRVRSFDLDDISTFV